MRTLIIGLLLLIPLQACVNNRPPELKSPCVGASGSPCGDRVPVNSRA